MYICMYIYICVCVCVFLMLVQKANNYETSNTIAYAS